MDAPVLVTAQTIIDMVERSIDTPIDKATWRAARVRLAAEQTAAGVSADLIDPLLAMAWNLDQTPGAARDVAAAWGAQIWFASYANDETPLSEHEEEILFCHMRKSHDAAIAELGAVTHHAEGYAAYQKITDVYWAGEPEAAALRERQNAQVARATVKVNAWRRFVQQKLVHFLVSAPIANPALDQTHNLQRED
jgi:hypothetical protein